MIRKINLPVIICFLGLACQDDDVTSRDYPRLNTLPVSSITNNGAVLSAEIPFRGEHEIIRYGFVWSTEENPTLGSSEEAIIDGDIKSNSYSIEINAGLVENEEYFVKAVLVTEKFTVYGKSVGFISLGSRAPAIDDISPILVTYGDTIHIKGSNFSTVNNKNNVMMGGKESRLISSSDSLIKAIIPEEIPSVKFDVSVSVLGNKALSKDSLKFKAPIIQSLSNTSPVFGDTVKIVGENFGYEKIHSSVIINDSTLKPLSVSRNQVYFQVPALEQNMNVVVVNSLGQKSNSKSATIPSPVLTRVSPDNGYYLDEITLEGENFGYLKEVVEVYFNDQIATITDFSNESIMVNAPFNFENPVTVKVLVNGKETGAKPFIFNDFSITSISPTEVTWRDNVTISGNNFSTVSGENSVKIDGYDAEIISFNSNELVAKVPDEVDSKNATIEVSRLTRSKTSATSLTMKDPIITTLSKTEFEVGDIITITGENFHPIPSNNQLRVSQKSLLINSSEMTLVTFSAPISMVANTLVTEEFTGILEYSNNIGSVNSSTVQITYDGPWTKIDDGHSFKGGMNSLSSGSKLYTAYNTLSSFDPNSNSWTDLTTVPNEERTWAMFFKNQDYIFIGSGVGPISGNLDDHHSYDINLNSWTTLSTPPFNGASGTKGTAGRDKPHYVEFKNMKLLINKNDFFQYDSENDLWTEFADISFPYQYQIMSGAFVKESKLIVAIYEINNQNTANSTLHFYEWNEQDLSFDLVKSITHFGVIFPSFVDVNETIYLVDKHNVVRLESDFELTSFSTPFSVGTTARFAETVNGMIYIGYSDGTFWSFDPSK